MFNITATIKDILIRKGGGKEFLQYGVVEALERGAGLYSGPLTSVGGAASEDFAIAGLLATDVVTVTLNTAGAVPVTVKSAKCGADKITVVFSADPAADHVLNVHVLRG